MRTLNTTLRLTAMTMVFLAVFAALPIGSNYSQAQSDSRYSKAKLLEALRTNAKDKSLSDEQFIQYVRERGVNFEVTVQDEAQLRQAGASPQIISAIRNSYRPGGPAPRSLTINSTPGDCQVFLNGQLRGSTNASGVLTIRSLKPGSYKVTLRKKNYADHERSVVVAASGTIESFLLSPVPGRLNVTPNIAGALITVRNLGQYPEKITDLEVAPGSYDIEVKKPGFRTVTQTVLIAAGAPFFLPITLEKMTVDEMLREGEAALRRGETNEAMSVFQAAAAEQPNNPKVSKLIGTAYFNSHQYESSTTYLAEAISRGDQVSFRVKHRHSPLVLCTGIITLTSKTFSFKSEDGYQVGHDFEIPYDKFKEYVIIDEILGAHLHTKARIPKPGGKKGEDEKDQNFYVPDTKYPSYEPCPACVRQLRVIFDLIKRFASGGGDLPTLKREGFEVQSPGPPTLTRRPPDQVNGDDRNIGREPVLAFVGRESFKAGGRNWTRYKLTVTNRALYTEDMFTSAPDLAPCGLNTKASRTWVEIFDAAGKRLNGFCALGSPNDLVSLWFALPEEATPPSQVFIVLVDRQYKKQYKSNLAAIASL